MEKPKVEEEKKE